MTYTKIIKLNDKEETTYRVGDNLSFMQDWATITEIKIVDTDFGVPEYQVETDKGYCIPIPYHSVLLTNEYPFED